MAQLPATRPAQGARPATRRDHPLLQLQRDFDSLFGRLWGGWLAPDIETVRMWDFDVTENDKEIVIRAEMPGFEPNELDVQLTNNVLTIKAEKEQKGDRQEEYRSFYRTMTLPPGINADKVQASYQNGVLELHLPRAPEAMPKRIQIAGQQSNGGATAGQQPQTKQPAGTRPADQSQQGQPSGQPAKAPEKAQK